VIDKNRVIQVDLCFDVLFDRYMSDHVAPWITVAQRIHPLISNQAELARLAFVELRELIAKSQRHRPPITEAAASALLQPLISAVQAVEGICEVDDDCDDEEDAVAIHELCSNHLRLVAGGINALLWVVSNAGWLHQSRLQLLVLKSCCKVICRKFCHVKYQAPCIYWYQLDVLVTLG
jgi:hypothetical protein